jgi:hypothetical protein
VHVSSFYGFVRYAEPLDWKGSGIWHEAENLREHHAITGCAIRSGEAPCLQDQATKYRGASDQGC